MAGPRGTEVIERLVPQAAERLRPGGHLLMEISPMIHDAVRKLLESDGRFDSAPRSRTSPGCREWCRRGRRLARRIRTCSASQLVICKDSDALAAEAAEFVVRCAQEAVGQRGRFTLVLSGGSTPEKMYALLAQPAGSESIEWPKTYIFFGDERFVPPDDPRSNFGMARRTLLAGVPVPPSQVFPVPTDEPTAAAAAARYAAELAPYVDAASCRVAAERRRR